MSDEDTKVASIFDKDIENFGKDLDKMIEHLNIVIATHNKQVEEIERLNNIIKEVREYAKNDDNFFIIDDYSRPIVEEIQEELLEILDKGSEKE